MKISRWHWMVVLGMVVSSLLFGQDYSLYSPDARKTLASDWLNTGKAFLQVKKYSKAKNCFMYAHRLYPMGEAAAEARDLLLKNFKVKISYDPEQAFSSYVAEAQRAANLQTKINLYLMALDAKKNARIYEQVALCYLQLKKVDKAKEYAFMAKEAGLSEQELDSRLRNL